jgi:hypothetical protein
MEKDKLVGPSFLVGGMVGIGLSVGLLWIADSTPNQIRKYYQTEAVKRGYGKYIIDTNSFVGANPTMKFEWITNSEIK